MWARDRYTGPGGGLYTGPGGGLYTGPGGGMYTGPGGGMYTGPGKYMRNCPPIHILIQELENREMFGQAEILRGYGF
jgi:hypothetical protein